MGEAITPANFWRPQFRQTFSNFSNPEKTRGAPDSYLKIPSRLRNCQLQVPLEVEVKLRTVEVVESLLQKQLKSLNSPTCSPPLHETGAGCGLLSGEDETEGPWAGEDTDPRRKAQME